jgi:hypothetical protein
MGERYPLVQPRATPYRPEPSPPAAPERESRWFRTRGRDRRGCNAKRSPLRGGSYRVYPVNRRMGRLRHLQLLPSQSRTLPAGRRAIHAERPNLAAIARHEAEPGTAESALCRARQLTDKPNTPQDPVRTGRHPPHRSTSATSDLGPAPRRVRARLSHIPTDAHCAGGRTVFVVLSSPHGAESSYGSRTTRRVTAGRGAAG